MRSVRIIQSLAFVTRNSVNVVNIGVNVAARQTRCKLLKMKAL